MSYQGYLVQVANSPQSDDWYTIPHSFIKEKSYKGTYSTMDLNSTRTADAYLNRTVLEHKVPHCTLTIKPLTDVKLRTLFGSNGNISNRYESAREKSIYVRMWIAELDDYVTEKCYVPDIDFTIKKVHNDYPYYIEYDQFVLEFIGY